MRELFSRHSYGQQDLDDTGQIQDIIKSATSSYQEMSNDPEIQALPKIKYRNALREAIYNLADSVAEE